MVWRHRERNGRCLEQKVSTEVRRDRFVPVAKHSELKVNVFK